MFEALRAEGSEAEAIFMPRWSCGPQRFAAWGNAPIAARADVDGADDSVSNDLWTTGFAAGQQAAEQALAAETAALDALVRALDRLTPVPTAALAERLEREVRTLLVALVGTASVDEALLVERCAALAELASGDAAAVLHAHPDDAALLTAAQPALVIVADARLPRGELLLVDGVGEAAAGPQTMLADWAAQAGQSSC